MLPVVDPGLGPDSVSLQLKETVTGDWAVQVPAIYGALFGPAVALPVTTGGVLSMRIGPNASGAFIDTLPALSVQLPLEFTPAAVVSCVNVCEPVGEPGATPEFAFAAEVLSTHE